MDSTAESQAAAPWTLDELDRVVSPSGHPAETFAAIVGLVQRHVAADVCSMYLLDSERATLVLSAAAGLNPHSIGRIGVRVGEGAIGRVAELRVPVRQDGMLGVPVLYRGLLQGVLVVQAAGDQDGPPGGGPEVFTDDHARSLLAGAEQLAPIVAIARAEGRRRAEWEMVQRAKAQVLETLAPGLTHELNNKLMPIASYSELLLEEAGDNPDTIEACTTMRDSAFEAARVLERLLLICTAGEIAYGGCDLADVVRQAAAAMQPRATAAGARLVVDVPGEATIAGDAPQLKEVCVNLLENALEAVAKLTAREITLRLDAGETSVTLSVNDTGAGIAPELLPRIFDPYFTTKESRSHGVGLAVCYGVVKQHGGDIRIVSTVGAGTTVTIVLPAHRAAAGAGTPIVAVAEPFARIESLRVLVIDDDERMLQLVGAVLESRLGCRVDRASNGLAARSALEQGRFDLVLSDIRMPHMDGVQLLDWITLNQPDVLTRTMFMTGDADIKGPIADIQRAGRPVLQKPFSLDSLVSAARRVITTPEGDRREA